VVATEVRHLAQRATAAAGEIKQLISASVEKIAQGDQLGRKAGQTMTGVVASVQSVAEIVSDIARDNLQQSSGVDEINRTVLEIDAGTQQNAAMVEQAAAAAAQLDEQAAHLAQAVGLFKLAPRRRRLRQHPRWRCWNGVRPANLRNGLHCGGWTGPQAACLQRCSAGGERIQLRPSGFYNH
jgi:hypothetical protein